MGTGLGTPITGGTGYLTSGSTRAQVLAAYRDNASYDVQNSPTMCRAFIDACRHLLILTADEVRQGQSMTAHNSLKIQSELDNAISWLVSNDTTAAGRVPGDRVVYADFGDFR